MNDMTHFFSAPDSFAMYSQNMQNGSQHLPAIPVFTIFKATHC